MNDHVPGVKAKYATVWGCCAGIFLFIAQLNVLAILTLNQRECMIWQATAFHFCGNRDVVFWFRASFSACCNEFGAVDSVDAAGASGAEPAVRTLKTRAASFGVVDLLTWGILDRFS
ncbi:unnamed protein product [Ostreobium quekettii]|uniref:Uncharacterized protein n=1 Tax=Ostreobium quekettii TaxID=121088 RepID=A0A8S1IKJ8_9CHLO|nr:unnamed protein product [Ostreobium quekettii]